MAMLSVKRIKRGLAVFLFGLCLIHIIQGQTTVTIQLPNGETPNEGQIIYQLICIAANFRSTQFQSLTWSFNGQIISWGEHIVLRSAVSRFSVEKRLMNGDLYSYLTIHQIYLTDTGNFQCSRVEGEINNFVIKASDRKTIIMNGLVPEGHYFPASPWPLCYPSVDISVLLSTEIAIGCISHKGNPAVGIEMFLEHGQNDLPLSGTISDKGFAYNEEVTLSVSQEINSARYICQIKVNGVDDLPPMLSSCLTGRIVVGLIEQKIVRIPEGGDAIFTCRKPVRGSIIWSTDPYLPASRMVSDSDSTRSFVTIRNLQGNENNTIVRCRTELPYGLQDEGKIIVFGSNYPNIDPTHTLLTSQGDTMLLKSTSPNIYYTSVAHVSSNPSMNPMTRILTNPESSGRENTDPSQFAAAGVGAIIVVGSVLLIITIVMLVFAARKRKDCSCVCNGFLINISVTKIDQNRESTKGQPQYEKNINRSVIDAGPPDQDVRTLPKRNEVLPRNYENDIIQTDIKESTSTQVSLNLNELKTGQYTGLNLSDVSHSLYAHPKHQEDYEMVCN